jgi:nucleotide-binding universal stress UspA family protein
MKRILVPTDFSENAKLALKHAIDIANRFGSTITILHAFQTTTVTGSFGNIDHVIKNDREEELADLIMDVKPLLGDKAHIEGLVKKGPSIDMICETAEKLKVSLIVMGTTGADGMKKLFLGSTASNVILETSKPVLAIPKEYKEFKISRIVLASDNKKIEKLAILNPLLELATNFGAALNLLTVMDSENPQVQTDNSLQEYLKKSGVDSGYHKVNSPDIVKGILEFINQENADMLCLIHHHRGLFDSIFHSSVAEKIAFSSKVPLLVLCD